MQLDPLPTGTPHQRESAGRVEVLRSSHQTDCSTRCKLSPPGPVDIDVLSERLSQVRSAFETGHSLRPWVLRRSTFRQLLPNRVRSVSGPKEQLQAIEALSIALIRPGAT